MKVGLADRLIADGVVRRIWARDPAVWTADASAHAAIRHRLGWLDAPAAMRAHVPRLTALSRAIRTERVAVAYLLGMGGSSLCAEVVRAVRGAAPGHPDLVVLDTTDEATLTTVASRLEPERTLFLVASKSGTTIEIASMERYFWQQMRDALGGRAGRGFIAITDPGTPLEALARQRGYRETYLNPPDVGGRFSALSLFGLVPAAVMGVETGDLLDAGQAMAEGCHQARHTNAGLELGAFMGAAANAGRDKLTVLLPHTLASIGLWIEQLVAESTGKAGRGLLPIVDEAAGEASSGARYGSDRACVAIETESDTLDAAGLDAIERAGHPLFRIRTRKDALGAEFFRWEFATAIAGAVLGVNPFDEPNVTEAKDRTKALLEAYSRDRRLPEDRPVAEDTEVAAFSPTVRGSTPAAVVRELVASLRDRDYFAVLSYLPPDSPTGRVIDELRGAIRTERGNATTSGIGPRYLHSTGQYHKGGPDTGVFLIITAEDRTTTNVPGTAYSFSALKRAQAAGDYQALAARGRRGVRVHLKRAGGDYATLLERLFSQALGTQHPPGTRH
jgi:glucose-6-phosphate isomerase